jgi:cytochrome c peroxidase
MRLSYGFYIVMVLAIWVGCKKDEKVDPGTSTTTSSTTGSTTSAFHTTPYIVSIPAGFPSLPVPLDNPLTVEGVELGRKLFYDKLLSKDSSISCGSCHNQLYGFTDNGKALSAGVSGNVGDRNAMVLFNLAWVERFAKTDHRFFWDGGAKNLESQAIAPITNPIEMEETLPNVLSKLQHHATYPGLFKKAFGSDSITTLRLMQAIAQFERTIVSGNTRFDYYNLFQMPTLSAQELRGMEVFNDSTKGDCFHCHNLQSSFISDFIFHNNGHSGPDVGLERITGNPDDRGKFRTATLRNLVFSAPYMHDGRFNTLEEVVEFYNSGASRVYPADPFITKHPSGLSMSPQDKEDLVAFLKSITDSTLLTNVAYRLN